MGKIYFCFICVEFQTGNSLSRHKKTSEELRAQGDEYYVPLSIRNAEQEAPLKKGAEKPTKDSSKNSDASKNLGGGNSKIFYVHPYLGKIPILTNIFQMG